MRVLRLINGLLLAGGLALGLVGQAGAARICVAGFCDFPEIEPPLPPLTGNDIPIDPSWIAPDVLQLIPFEDSNGWTYGFSLVKKQRGVSSLALPNVAAWDLSAVLPATWGKAVEPGSPGSSLGTVVWTTSDQPLASDVQMLFNFRSTHAPTQAALQIRDADGRLYERNVFLPLTPEALAAGYSLVALPVLPAVPEPSGVLLFAVGAAVVALRRRKA